MAGCGKEFLDNVLSVMFFKRCVSQSLLLCCLLKCPFKIHLCLSQTRTMLWNIPQVSVTERCLQAPIYEMFDSTANLCTYLVEESPNGKGLMEYMTENKHSEKKARNIINQMTCALRHCHKHDVIHGYVSRHLHVIGTIIYQGGNRVFQLGGGGSNISAILPLCSHPRYTRWGGGGGGLCQYWLDWTSGERGPSHHASAVHQISSALWPTSGADPGFCNWGG